MFDPIWFYMYYVRFWKVSKLLFGPIRFCLQPKFSKGIQIDCKMLIWQSVLPIWGNSPHLSGTMNLSWVPVLRSCLTTESNPWTVICIHHIFSLTYSMFQVEPEKLLCDFCMTRMQAVNGTHQWGYCKTWIFASILISLFSLWYRYLIRENKMQQICIFK